MVILGIVYGFTTLLIWLVVEPYPSEKYESQWDYCFQYMEK
jgi:hypothetical protein